MMRRAKHGYFHDWGFSQRSVMNYSGVSILRGDTTDKPHTAHMNADRNALACSYIHTASQVNIIHSTH